MQMSLSYKLVIGCSLILLISLSTTFYIINERQQQLIIRQAENEARAIFQQIVIMRRWIADHGGVFVEQLPWAHEGPPAQALHGSSEARHYALKTPAMVTKELVKYAREKGLYWFHITSLQLMNPENVPDDFERAALLRFEEDPVPPEIITMEEYDKVTYLRYISPIYVEEACLACHLGYEVGGVRGAISVTLPLGKIFAEAKANRNLMFGSMLLLVILLSSILLFFLRRMVLVPVEQLTTSIRRFSEKEPPPTAIVRSGDEFEELSRSFEEMAASLHEYQSGLEGKIRSATAELQQLNQQIVTASERKSEFLARAAHELRTPLTSIKGAMEYITARMKQMSGSTATDSDDLIEFFAIIQKNTERLIRMVQTMLDIEYIEAGAEQALNLSEVDLTSVINECVQSFTYDAERNSLDLCALPSDLPTVRADEDRLRQVLTNLLGNAVKFAAEQTAITISAELKSDLIEIRICNRGASIPAEQRELVFSRFHRSGAKAGTGLGLAICRAIIEAHGGIIGIADPEDSAGVCAYFTLPVRTSSQGE